MSPEILFSAEDSAYMAKAVQLARLGLYSTDPNPRVGCVIVKDDTIIGEGWHCRAGGPHAEVVALHHAGAHAAGATAYVSLEPCNHHGKTPPCSQALIRAGVARVIAAMEDPNPRVAGSGLARLCEAGIETRCGLLQTEAETLNPGFIHRMRYGRPLIRSKLAMSLDGRTAMASGESRWITGEDARRDVHRWRARSSAIVTGIGTLLADDPALTARIDDPHCELLQPVRIILDSRLRCPASASFLTLPGRSVILTTTNTDGHGYPEGVEIVRLAATASGRIDLDGVIAWLGEQEFNEILFEAGPTLNGALLQAGIVDEWIVYMATVVMGDEGRGLFRLPELTRMADRYALELIQTRQVGQDLRLLLRSTPDAIHDAQTGA